MSKKEEILQQPTADEVRKNYADGREAQYGNTGNVWDVLPVSGVSYKIPEQPMSDDLRYKYSRREERKMEQQDMEVLAGRQNKRELIKKWEKYIEKMNDQIKRIQADVTLNTAVKQRKILRCTEIIASYKQEIDKAEKYLAAEAAKNHELYEQYMKTK